MDQTDRPLQITATYIEAPLTNYYEQYRGPPPYKLPSSGRVNVQWRRLAHQFVHKLLLEWVSNSKVSSPRIILGMVRWT